MKKLAVNIFLLLLFIIIVRHGTAQNTTAMTVNIGVILDYRNWIAKIGLSCIEMAISEFYEANSHYKTRLVLHARDSKSDVVGAASAAVDLITNVKVKAILGSMTSTQANFVVDIGEKAQVPIISYSPLEPSLAQSSRYFLRATPSLASQAKATSAIVKAFTWTKVSLIFSDVLYGDGVVPRLIDTFLEDDIYVSSVTVVSSSSTDAQIGEELRGLTKRQTRVFIVHADVSLGARIFAKAKDIDMMKEGYVWIVTDEMAGFLSSLEPTVIDSMQGVLGIKSYVSETRELKEFRARRRKSQLKLHNAFELRAYDAATALAIAAEEVTENSRDVSRINSTVFGVFVPRNCPEFLQVLSGSNRVKGLSGPFAFVSSSTRLESSTYQIINVHGNGEKVVGSWTLRNGLQRHLDSKNSSFVDRSSTSSKDNLGLIIWPGESTSIPKGWEICALSPTEKLRIGVPVKHGLTEFVKVEYDPVANKTNFTGYCIDIFHAVMKELPYEFDYEFVPYELHTGLYDDLISQVYYKRFDAAVGDITITTNRSLYVDFTFPYTELGVSIIMPAKSRNNVNTWIFLKPWTWDLWVLIASFFFFNAFVVWVLEHRVSKDFQGAPSCQIGTSLWFSFSTMVYAHREKLANNLTRFVVVIWIFVVLILTQSYAASLTSLLTIQQLRPPNTENVLSELIKSGQNVAYQSYIVYIALRELGFSDSQFRRYNKLEEARELMSRGEVAAIIDEIPYNKLFLAKYCSNYGYFDIVDKRIRADGFAFVFQRGSPLTLDFSKALVKIMRGSEFIAALENQWFGRKTDCKDPSEEVISSNRLGPKSFWGLFLISGFSSISALVMHVVTISPVEASTWKRFLLRFEAFYRMPYWGIKLIFGRILNGNSNSTVPVEVIEEERNVEPNYVAEIELSEPYVTNCNAEPLTVHEVAIQINQE